MLIRPWRTPCQDRFTGGQCVHGAGLRWRGPDRAQARRPGGHAGSYRREASSLAVPPASCSLGTPTLERVGESLSGLPQPFVVRLFGDRIETLRTLSEEVTRRLHRVPELTDIFNNDGYPVTQLQILPQAPALAAYGLSPMRLYDRLRPLLAGEVVADVPKGITISPCTSPDASDQSLTSLRALPFAPRGGRRWRSAEVRLVPTRTRSAMSTVPVPWKSSPRRVAPGHRSALPEGNWQRCDCRRATESVSEVFSPSLKGQPSASPLLLLRRSTDGMYPGPSV